MWKTKKQSLQQRYIFKCFVQKYTVKNQFKYDCGSYSEGKVVLFQRLSWKIYKTSNTNETQKLSELREKINQPTVQPSFQMFKALFLNCTTISIRKGICLQKLL